jgi:hypothetical protein
MGDPLGIALQPVIHAFERLGVRYYVGGSVASMVHGEYRLTADVDIVADLLPEHVEPMVQSLQGEFLMEEGAMRDAIRHHRSFNLIHLTEFFKVDIFIPKGRPYDEQAALRRRKDIIKVDPAVEAFLASPEDILLAKLEWFRMGGEVSDRQWRDIKGICQVQSQGLDFGYLKRWAVELNVQDLLMRAFEDSGITETYDG